jgi:hypothetical protein
LQGPSKVEPGNPFSRKIFLYLPKYHHFSLTRTGRLKRRPPAIGTRFETTSNHG